MFSKYKNTHKTQLATGRIKIHVGDFGPSRPLNLKEEESVRDWINKGYLTIPEPEVVEVQEVVEVVEPIVEVPEVPELDPEPGLDVQEEEETKPKRSRKK